MPRRHALPAVWLFADARLGDAVYAAVARLPKGRAGVVRHGFGDARRLQALCRARRLVFTDIADGIVAKAHNRRELVAARRAGAALVFLSPVFATRSHPGARALGRVRFGLLAREARVAVGALGGMDAKKFRSLRALGAQAWGAIDALIPASPSGDAIKS